MTPPGLNPASLAPASLPRLAEYGDEPEPALLSLLQGIAGGRPLSDAALGLVEEAVAGRGDPGIIRLLPALEASPLASALPPALLAGLQRQRRRAEVRFVVIEHIARLITDDFLAHGFAPLFLKGFALALQAWSHPACRPMGDLDLAVLPEHFPQAVCRLEALGFHKKVNDGDRNPARPGINCHALTFHHPQARLDVDLHYHILALSIWPAADAGFHAGAVALKATRLDGALTLAPEHHVVQACLHGYARSLLQVSVRWMLDVHMILTGPAGNRNQSGDGAAFRWELVLAEARRHRCGPVLAAALGWLAQELETPVPPEVLDQLARLPASRYDLASYRLLRQVVHDPSPLTRLRLHWNLCQRLEGRPVRSPLEFVRLLGRRWGYDCLAGILPALWQRRAEPAFTRRKRMLAAARQEPGRQGAAGHQGTEHQAGAAGR